MLLLEKIENLGMKIPLQRKLPLLLRNVDELSAALQLRFPSGLRERLIGTLPDMVPRWYHKRNSKSKPTCAR